MIFGILADGSGADFVIPKLVCSIWIRSLDTPAVLNLSVVVSNPESRPLSSVMLALTDRGENFTDISSTLLDARNPLSYTFVGRYELGQGNQLAFYDGIPNVEVVETTISGPQKKDGLFLYRVKLPQKRRKTIAFRLLAEVPLGNRISVPESGRCDCDLRFFDPSVLKTERAQLSERAIPVLIRYNRQTQDGGFDPFLYLPEGLELIEARPAVNHILRPIHYDWLGRTARERWTRFAWWPHQVIDDSFELDSEPFFVPPRRVLISTVIGGSAEIGPQPRQMLESPVLQSLSPKEREVLAELSGGSLPKNTQIADSLHLSPRTIDAHLRSIFEKLDVHDRRAAVRRAQELGFEGSTSSRDQLTP
jgi:DNA-binding CsgD family transcriptional regulator